MGIVHAHGQLHRSTPTAKLAHLATPVGAIALLSACALGSSPSASLATNVPTITSGTGGRLALTTGQLAIEGGCLVLSLPNGGTAMLIWPSPASTWDEATKTIALEGTEARVGDTVSLSGSNIEPPEDDSEYAVPPTPGCRKPSAWLVTGLDLGAEISS
jgi:hypothetical protein